MNFRALITLDLPNTFSEKKNLFYEELHAMQWYKIKNISTAWGVNFNEGFDRLSAVSTLKYDIKKAKYLSGIPKVSYAIQLANYHIETGFFD